MNPTLWWIAGILAYSFVFRAVKNAVLSFKGAGSVIPWWLDFNYDLLDYAIIGGTIGVLVALIHALRVT